MKKTGVEFEVSNSALKSNSREHSDFGYYPSPELGRLDVECDSIRPLGMKTLHTASDPYMTYEQYVTIPLCGDRKLVPISRKRMC